MQYARYTQYERTKDKHKNAVIEKSFLCRFYSNTIISLTGRHVEGFNNATISSTQAVSKQVAIECNKQHV